MYIMCIFPTEGTDAYKLQKLNIAGGKVIGNLDIEQETPIATLSELACSV